ncbi:5801_t:CDS:2 [Acaulospora colombiana]|uniref:5801_t:CDS:1 n=1 Tax=Acaulospora colombiana TaxID=27376 RepID=A0ACA9KMC8_9GLOM|nr:5801_t:CDS:2 [Acaulospora colombiana]
MLKRNNLKYFGLAVATLFFFHWVLTITNPRSEYSKQWSSPEYPVVDGEIEPPRPKHKVIDHGSENKQHGSEHKQHDSEHKQHESEQKQHDSGQTQPGSNVKAAFVVLIRNGDLHSFRATMRQLEDRYNHKYNYPYVFLNNEPFTEEFKMLTSAMTKSKTEYGLIPRKHWSVPEMIDLDRVNRNMAKMRENNVIYGDSLPYRHMCRFESGFFYRHELLEKYDYYWRVEPGVQFYCDLDFDPFMYMKENDIKYGFTISLYEYPNTIPTLWESVKEFSKKYPEYIEKDNLMEFISNDDGVSYNLYDDDITYLRSEFFNIKWVIIHLLLPQVSLLVKL